MKEEIQKFNSQNGNVTYTVKELLAGLHTKIDDIDEKLNKGSVKIATNREGLKNLRRVVYFALPIIGGALAFIIKSTI